MAVDTGAPLSVRELPALLTRVHAALERRRETIDELNVFPVPDGDTGTNMTLTVRAGCDVLAAASDPATPQVATDVVRAVVGGARGNSGVILSQVIRAVIDVVSGHRHVDANMYADALEAACSLAYGAVAEPVEGTILTVIRAASVAARDAADSGADLVATSERAFAAAAEAVERTPDQLEVLRHAGVVDAGARGFEVVLAAVHGHLTGAEPDVVDDHPRPLEQLTATGGVAPSPTAFEVQFLLDAVDAVRSALRSELETLGDSVAVVAAGGVLNVHIHTDDVGAVIETGTRFGVPSNIQVEHFGDQIARRAAAHRAAIRPVAVLAGDGLAALARSHGAVVVDGRAGALPSVDQIHRAIVAANAVRVIVFPGHRHGVAAAHQAARLAEGDGIDVRVCAAASNPLATLAGVAVFDAAGDIDVVTAAVEDAASAVRAAEIVSALRDSDTPLGPVRTGEAIVARGDGTVVALAADAPSAVEPACAAIDAQAAELVTVLVGADVDADEIAKVESAVRTCCPHAEIDVVDGGVRPARFWIGAE
ncbi:MAG: DAK2 domain-containing protein [Nitriliruptoraceae bacterium]